MQTKTTNRRSFFQLIVGAFASLGLVEATPTPNKNAYTLRFVNVLDIPPVNVPVIMDTIPNGIRQRYPVEFIAPQRCRVIVHLFRNEEDLGPIDLYYKPDGAEWAGKKIMVVPEKMIIMLTGETLTVSDLEITIGHQTVPFLRREAQVSLKQHLLVA
jgi:hypothetical protein